MWAIGEHFELESVWTVREGAWLSDARPPF